ncbi:uncharacterized protein [Diadema antillarum]|uniref:uncharacterized protein isoform X1 n=2 Tax=Diadema antillarum TaxID=105358 RepID=UPI003A882151
MDRRYHLVLLLTLTVDVFCGLSAEASVVSTVPDVLGWKGEDISLPCDIPEEPLAVYWIKETISGQETKAGFFDGSFESTEERFKMNMNFSLVITDLEVADEGLYNCQVALIDFETLENSTFVTVNSMASRQVIEECVRESLTDQGLRSYQTPPNSHSFNLTCVVSGFKPNISMLWTEETGKRLNSVVSQQTTLPDDTYERFETIIVSAKYGTEQTFLCVATGDSLNGTWTTGISVLSISGKGDKFDLIIGLASGLHVAVIILFLLVGLCLQKYQPNYLRKTCGWTPCWRLYRKQSYDREGLIMDSFPSCPSLTAKQVHQCKEELKTYYRKTRGKVTVDPLNFMERVNLDQIYTNLSLINCSDMHKTPIMYEDLLADDKSGNLSKRVLIQGEGGAGKTTLCAKIAWDWSQGKILQDLDMVIVIPLRDVTVDKTIGVIVERYLSDSNEVTPAQIDNYISTNLSKVFLMFDGFDEFNEKIDRNSSSEVIRILGLEQYESCKVIVTSRPWRTDEFMLHKSLAESYTFIVVEGYSKENLTTYIKKYFRIWKEDVLAETLLSFMEENHVIRSYMAPFPIYCAMLCLMWKDVSEERRQEIQRMQTFSEIFGEMILFLKEHYVSKNCENIHSKDAVRDIKEASRAIQVIGGTALEGLLERRLSFPEKQFKKSRDAMETCCKIGVLTIETNVINRRRRRDVDIPSFVVSTVSFPHKLFQEYIAGVHIEHLFVNDRAKYEKFKNILLRQYEEFRYVLYFASTFRKDLGLDIIKGLTKKDDRHFCVDVAFESHTVEAARAVGGKWGEYDLSRYTSEHTKPGVVFMMHCNQVNSLRIANVNFGRTVSYDLAKGMCSSSVLHKVTVLNSQLHADFYRILGKEASNCQIQELHWSVDSLDDGFEHESLMAEDLARWVCNMSRLSHLCLSFRNLPDSFFLTAISSASSCQIQHLELIIPNWETDRQHQSSVGEYLVQWVRTLPRLSSLSVKGPSSSDEVLSTVVDMAKSCQLDDITFNGKPLNQLVLDNE